MSQKEVTSMPSFIFNYAVAFVIGMFSVSSIHQFVQKKQYDLDQLKMEQSHQNSQLY